MTIARNSVRAKQVKLLRFEKELRRQAPAILAGASLVAAATVLFEHVDSLESVQADYFNEIALIDTSAAVDFGATIGQWRKNITLLVTCEDKVTRIALLHSLFESVDAAHARAEVAAKTVGARLLAADEEDDGTTNSGGTDKRNLSTWLTAFLK